MKTDVLIIGGGIAGLTAARKFLETNMGVIIASKSTGASWLSTGVIDVAAYLPEFSDDFYPSALECLEKIVTTRQNHPYTKIGKDHVVGAINEFKQVMAKHAHKLDG
ncbi:MAG: FAD-dependent oxidoreductase, partial [Candidatus Helarchaeota archaeon]